MRDAAAELDSVLTLNQGALDAVGPLDDGRLRWLLGMATEAGQALVVDDAGTVAGFAMVFAPDTAYDSGNYRWFVERFAAFGYLDRIVVAASHRRLGVGTLLYDAAEQAARGSGRLVCEVYVEPPNVASLAFHERRGYVEVGRLPQSNDKTCVMLAKQLR